MTDQGRVESPLPVCRPRRGGALVNGPEQVQAPCPNCGDDCWHLPAGYPWCRPCGEHHRPPECSVDEQGRALSSCGCPWEVIDPAPHRHLPGCVYEEQPLDKTCDNCGVRWGEGEWHPEPCRARVPVNAPAHSDKPSSVTAPASDASQPEPSTDKQSPGSDLTAHAHADPSAPAREQP